MDIYAIGARVWHMGDQYEIVSVAYVESGIEFQNGLRTDEAGLHRACIPTPRYKAGQVAKKQAEYRDQQAQFRGLRAAKKIEDEPGEESGHYAPTGDGD